MKKLLLILPLFALLFSCEKDVDDTTPPSTTKLSTPTLQTPTNEEELIAATFSFNFSWSAVSNAESYEMQFADNSNFTNSENFTTSTNNKNVTSSNAQSGNTYYWRVKATTTDTAYTSSDFSQTFSFDYSDGSGGGGSQTAPTLLTPTDNSTVNTTRPTFTWSNTPLNGSPYYIVQFAADLAFNSIFYTGQSIPTSFTIPQAIDPLAPYATLFWRVSADGGTTYSNYFTLNIQ